MKTVLFVTSQTIL